MIEKEYDDNIELNNMQNLFASYCYILVHKNKNLLDLKKYNKEHNFLMDNLDKYIISQPKFQKELNILKNIYKHHIYIDIESIINILDNNIKEINTKYADYVHILILSKETSPKKSNFFFYLYFLKRYEEITGKKIIDIFNDIYDFLNDPICDDYDKINTRDYLIDDYPLDKKYLLIYCDDVSYSGSQLVANIIYKNDQTCKINLVDNIKIYFNIFGITNKANRLFNRIINKNCIIIPDNTKKYNEDIIDILYKVSDISQQEDDKLNNFIIENDIYKIVKDETLNKYYIIRGELGDLYYYSFIETLDKTKHLFNLNLSLIYIDFKYPDNLSTIPNLCRLQTIDAKEYYIDYIKFIEIYKDASIFQKLYDYNTHNVDITDLFKTYNYNLDIIPWLKKGDKNPDELLYLDTNTKNYLQLINNFDIKIKKIMNESKYILCNKYSIVPFYKSLKYIDHNNIHYNFELPLKYSFENYTLILSTQTRYITNKYTKYKSKYLQTKS